MRAGVLRYKRAMMIMAVMFIGMSSSGCESNTQKESSYFDIQGQEIADKVIINAVDKEIIEYLSTEQSLSKEEAEQLKEGGLKVETTIDLTIQECLDRVWKEESTFTTREKPTKNEASMVIMNQQGEVKAFKENRKEGERNYATEELLQIGSVIKPLSAYALAFENNLMQYSTLLDDEPVMLQTNQGVTRWPSNADGQYEIKVTAQRALEVSKNTVAVRTVNELGEETVFSFLQDSLGFNELVRENGSETDLQLSALGLGYLAKGTTVSHVTGTYMIFNGTGKYQKQSMIRKITDQAGNVLYERNFQPKQIIGSDTSSILNRLLLTVVQGDNGTGRKAAIEGTEVIGKTGTVGSEFGIGSSLFVGMTPEYIAGVWIGAGSEGSYNKYTNIIAADVWNKVMCELPMEIKEFPSFSEVEERTYCKASGKTATKSCREQAVGVYKKGLELGTCTTCNNKE